MHASMESSLARRLRRVCPVMALLFLEERLYGHAPLACVSFVALGSVKILRLVVGDADVRIFGSPVTFALGTTFK